jgi:O-methyltransferase involved in polyketide biosynthesis
VHGVQAPGGKVRVEVEAVPETLLWTLYHRALETRRSDAVLDDPKAVELVDAIDYPFETRFGNGAGGQARWQALRVRCFDEQVERFLEVHPDGTVVALGEGLETQFWRVDNGRVRWLTVDLPETVGLRRRLLPPSPRHHLIARSALDPGWMAEVDASRGVLLTAQGLLMYFEYDEVRRLVAACAEWFPGGALLFDAVPCWLSVRSRSGKLNDPGTYRSPPRHWGIDANTADDLATVHPNVAELRELRLPRGRGAALGYAVPLLSGVPALRRRLPISVLLARFRY